MPACQASTAPPLAGANVHGRQQRLEQAVRGLAFEDGSVSLLPTARAVLPQAANEADAGTQIRNGESEFARGRNYEATESFKFAILIDPHQAMAYDGLGRALSGAGRSDWAIAAFQTALQLEPSLVETRYQLGMAYWCVGDMPAAIGALNQLVAIRPEHANAHLRLAIALYYAGDSPGSWWHLHQAEGLCREPPPQFRALLDAQMPEPEP
jgi:tetratricopeptide (TPR) repeat protein